MTQFSLHQNIINNSGQDPLGLLPHIMCDLYHIMPTNTHALTHNMVRSCRINVLSIKT